MNAEYANLKLLNLI